MRLNIDTTLKTIKIDTSVNLGELVEALKKLFPENEWTTFRLETNTQIIWRDPIIIHDYKSPYTYPWYNPLQIPTITCKGYASGDGKYALQDGTFCVEF